MRPSEFSVCFKASEAYLSTFGGPPGTVWAASMVTIHVYSQTVKDISRHVLKVIRKEQSKVQFV